MWMNLGLQDANSFITEKMIFFHDSVMMIILMIIIFIFLFLLEIINNKFINRYMLQGQFLETIWTIFPMLILLYLAMPSLKILYLTDEIYLPSMSIKVIGHQWYWSYEYSDLKKIKFDSYMIKDMDNINNFRLLDVDNRMVVPKMTLIRILTSSMDVIHSWAVPSLSMKLDAIPGRINQMPLILIRPGLYYGQCSEICGANHSFMPIVVESTNLKGFFKWINKY